MTHTHSIEFHDHTLNLIEHEGNPFVAIKPISDRLGLSWGTQFRKLNTEKTRWSMFMMNIETPAGKREAACLPLAKFFSWLGSLTPSKVKAHIRPMLEIYQEKCDRVLFEFWTGVQSDRERALENKYLGLLGKMITRIPIYGNILPIAKQGRTFEEIKATQNYSKVKIADALSDLVILKEIDQLPEGTPIGGIQTVKSKGLVTQNAVPTNDTLPLFT
jgi:P22_AR N-terminal domain